MRARWLAGAGACLAVAVASACGGFAADSTASDAGADASANATDAPDDTSPATSAADADAACTVCDPVILAPEIAHPYRLAASGGVVYWSDFTQDLWTCNPDACVPQALGADGGTLLKSLVGATSARIGAIDTTCSSVNDRTAGEYLYPRGSGNVLVRGVACPAFVNTHGDSLYFTNSGTLGTVHTDWSVTRCEADGGCTDLVGSTAQLADGILEYAVATDTKIIGGTVTGALVQWNNAVDAGASLVAESLGTTFHDLATDGTRVFWLDGQSVRGCDLSQCTVTMRVIASDSTAQVLAADATGLYWTSKGSGPGDGKVMWLAPSATVAVAIATGQVSPVGIALDAGYVYWANDRDAAGNITKGSLLRRVKPL